MNGEHEEFQSQSIACVCCLSVWDWLVSTDSVWHWLLETVRPRDWTGSVALREHGSTESLSFKERELQHSPIEIHSDLRLFQKHGYSRDRVFD